MIKKPKGRPNNDMKALYDLLERKKRMRDKLYQKAEDCLNAGKTSESRQCLASAQTLDADIEKMERRINNEPEEEKEELIYGEQPTESIFKPMWKDEVTGEMVPYVGQDQPTLRRRKPL